MKKKLTLLISFALMVATQIMSTQSTTVNGLIYDQSGKTIPGANVVETGTANRAIGLNFYLKSSNIF